MSKTVFLALLALVCSVAAHAGHGGDMPYGWRNTRAITASSCAAFTCAVSLGNCNANTFCLNGEHCGSNGLCKTTTAVNVGDACDVADENGCSKGKCISGTCQIVNEIMPGNECKFDTECYYSETADGSGAIGGKCVAGICSGKTVNEVCLASHQCVVGHFCKSGTCQPVGTTSNDVCTADNECSSRLSCIRGFCTAPFSHNLGETCVDTNDCSSGLYCNPKSLVCTKAVATTSTAQCDINTNNCPADHECACRGTGTVATCGAYVGTADNMASIESAAFACLSKHSCSSDTANSTALECIKTKCPKEYCTYFSRSMSELYGMSECVRARALDNPALYNLAQACAAYAPSATTSSAGVLSASVLVVLVSVVALLF